MFPPSEAAKAVDEFYSTAGVNSRILGCFLVKVLIKFTG
jgi:hypothetical protein